MKKVICLVLVLILVATCLTGCKKKPDGRFTAYNEILTYEKVDPEKTQLIVSKTGNVAGNGFYDTFEALNPDIQVIVIDITGGNSEVMPVLQWVQHGKLPDIMISTANFFTKDETLEYFENLSATPYITQYKADALRRASTDSNIYWLPGPSNINTIMFNKTLFEKYGWEVPDTFDEFVALCKQIREDTNGEVEPFNPNAKYDGELQIALEAFAYEEVFGGADNRQWYNEFCEGKEHFKGHMEPYYEMIQTLADNDILREEHFTYSATTRGKEFAAGKIAMINTIAEDMDNDEFEFGYMPFPATKGELGYINDNFCCFVGVPQKENTEKKQDAINRFLEFFSTPEGQEAYIGNSIKVSNVLNVPLNKKDNLAALQPAIEAGHMFEKLDFRSELGVCNAAFRQSALDITTGATTGAECINKVDANPYSSADTMPEKPEVIATAAEDLSILETSLYIADAYRDKADADIGLISDNEAFRGNLMRIFAGDITPGFVSVLKPRSFENESTLLKVSMTGQQLLDALNAPPGYGDAASNSIYAFSGLKCEVAPWNDLGIKYLSVKLADGSEIDPQKFYTVAIWSGTVSPEYITETLETYEGTWEELLTAKMKADGSILPAKDGRIKLVWNT